MSTIITPSQDQEIIINKLTAWVKREKKISDFVTLGGYAGTGKTTLISILRAQLHRDNPKLKVAFISYTGKAARVLKTTLQQSKSIYNQDSVGTIHSLVYSPLLNDSEEIVGWKKKDKVSAKLIVVDEASMVDSKIWDDLRSYNIPIIAIGDHGQLPPISGNFNLMSKPMLRLEKIHRQAQDNPIIELSIQARKHGSILPGNYGHGVKKINKRNDESQELIGELLASYNQDTLVLCGYNHTRVNLNTHIRGELGFESSSPTVRDRVICLRNNHKKNIFNGMMGSISNIKTQGDNFYKAEIAMDEEERPFKGIIAAEQFNSKTSINFGKNRKKTTQADLFDFGYAITVHKAQGSQSRKVILFEERFSKMDDLMWKRWLYTAVTRAEEELVIIG